MGSLSSSVRDPSAVEAKEAQVARAVSTEAGVGMTETQDWVPSVPCECTPSHIDEPRSTVHRHTPSRRHPVCTVLCCAASFARTCGSENQWKPAGQGVGWRCWHRKGRGTVSRTSCRRREVRLRARACSQPTSTRQDALPSLHHSTVGVLVVVVGGGGSGG